MTDDGGLPQFSIGDRIRVRSAGSRSLRLEGRTGKVIGFAHTRNALRVLIDGHKQPQTLHRSYLQPILPGDKFDK